MFCPLGMVESRTNQKGTLRLLLWLCWLLGLLIKSQLFYRCTSVVFLVAFSHFYSAFGALDQRKRKKTAPHSCLSICDFAIHSICFMVIITKFEIQVGIGVFPPHFLRVILLETS